VDAVCWGYDASIYAYSPGFLRADPPSPETELPDLGLTETFRGLRVKTAQGGFNSPAQIAQQIAFTADEIVLRTRLGYMARSAAWPTTVIDRAVVGPGGLTAAPTVSAWYRLYAIRKSSDNTRAGIAHVHPSLLSGFANSGVPTGWVALRDATARTRLAQSFRLTTGGQVLLMRWYAQRIGTPTGAAWVTVEADSGGSPSGVALATAALNDAAAMATSTQPVGWVWRIPALVPPGQYWAVLHGDYAVSASHHLRFQGGALGTGGECKQFDGAAWGAAALADLFLDVMTAPEASDLPLPSGYDQSAHIGYAYHDAAAGRWMRFAAQDRDVSWGETLTSILLLENQGFAFPLGPRAPLAPVTLKLSAGGDPADIITVRSAPEGYGDSRHGVAITGSPPVSDNTRPTFVLGELPTEFQALYFDGLASQPHVWVTGFRW
jgi:hypothetical protein